MILVPISGIGGTLRNTDTNRQTKRCRHKHADTDRQTQTRRHRQADTKTQKHIDTDTNTGCSLMILGKYQVTTLVRKQPVSLK